MAIFCQTMRLISLPMRIAIGIRPRFVVLNNHIRFFNDRNHGAELDDGLTYICVELPEFIKHQDDLERDLDR